MEVKQTRMSCAEVREAVYAYVACLLPLDGIAVFYEHLADCEDCRMHVTCYRKVVSVLGEERKCLPHMLAATAAPVKIQQ